MARPTQDDEPRRLSDKELYSDSEVWNSEGDDNESNASEDESNLEEDKLGSLHKEDKLSTPVLHARVSESEYETEEYDSAEDRVVGKKDDEEASGPEEEEEEDEDGDDERDITHVSENEVKRRDWQWFYKTHPVAAPEPSTAPQLKIHPEDIMSTISPVFIQKPDLADYKSSSNWPAFTSRQTILPTTAAHGMSKANSTSTSAQRLCSIMTTRTSPREFVQAG